MAAAEMKSELALAAGNPCKNALSHIEKFMMGAALLPNHREIFTGAKVESASFGLTCCAERVALFNALTGEKWDFVAAVVIAHKSGGDAVRGISSDAHGIRAGCEGVVC